MKKLLFLLILTAFVACEKEKMYGEAIFYTSANYPYSVNIDGVTYEVINHTNQMPVCDDPDFIKHRLKRGEHVIEAYTINGLPSGQPHTIVISGGECHVFRLP